MKRAIVKFLLIFAVFTAVFVVQKPIFMGVHATATGAESLWDWLAVPWHGLSMDLAVAGYLSVIPGLLIICMLHTSREWPQKALEVYIALCAAIISAIFCLDIVLYSYWGFRIDMTPLFYLATSPSAAMASATWWQTLLGAIGFLLCTVLLWYVLRLAINRVKVTPVRGWKATAVMVALVAALIIPIRGSLTVSTMNPSRAYFSHKRGLNHAATNPAFNLLYSATHQNDFDSRYRFFDPEEARRIFREMQTVPADTATSTENADTLSRTPLLSIRRPDIVLIILESFSSHLLPSLGGEPVATGLDSIARDGVLFTNFYANSFRTDRALPSILSALPAQPSASILKYVDKIERLPSIPAALSRAGYSTAYYYGGDTNFTNMQAYLMAMGFGKVVSDRDFSISEKASKWGAPDHLVFSRALADISSRKYDAARPRLSVIQTSSSHEPFEVPYSDPRFHADKRRNAFAYTDSCLTAFVNALSHTDDWGNTLVVLVPDHYGCWPQGLTKMPDRHAVPLVLTGGALTRREERIATPGTQADIAATLLGALDIPTDEFPFSLDLLGGRAAPVAVMTEPGCIALVTPEGYLAWNCDGSTIEDSDLPPGERQRLVTMAKAYLQTLYTYISEL